MSSEDTTSSADSLRALLGEREKELDAVYSLASLFSRPEDRVRPLFEQSAAILREAMEFPQFTGIHINLKDISITDGTQAPAVDSCTVSELVAENDTLSITVWYGERSVENTIRSEGTILGFAPRERRLIETTISLLANAVLRIRTESALRDSMKSLREQTAEMERKNIALREVLSQIEQEREQTVARARQHLDTFVFPLLRRLTAGEQATKAMRTGLKQVETSLEHMFSGDRDTLASLAKWLSPRELEICGLIRGGMSSKEIAGFLSISEATVERHRNTIRHKLGISGSVVNLTTWLRSCE